jgi:hypothetical protein
VLSFAAGVMLAAAVIGLILPSVEYGGNMGIPTAVIGIFCGALCLNLLDKAVPHLHHLTGDASSVKKKIRHVLLNLQESELDYTSVLQAVLETIPPRSIVYFLSMSHQTVPDCIGTLEEQDCTCFWIYAPAENFPRIEPDKPRFIDKRKALAGLNKHCMPEIADFTSGAEILESRNDYEKI